MAGPGDEMTAGAAGRGRLRASHADREQVIDILKAAFVQGRLAKDEFEARIGQALASRTYAELTAVTTDLLAGPPAAQRSKPARAQDPKPVLRPAPVIMAASALYAGLLALVIVVHNGALGSVVAEMLAMLTVFIVAGMIGFGIAKLASRHQRRSGAQLPRRPVPGAGGQPSRRLPSGGPAGQLPPIGDSQQHGAEAASNRLPRPQWPGSGSPRRWRPRGMLGAGGTIAVQLTGHQSESRGLNHGCRGSAKSAVQRLHRPRFVRFPS
jgi:energy-converting hydrogenase Eha subunit A